MQKTFCDGCEMDMTVEHYDVVEVRGKRLDLCGKCLQNFNEYERQVDALADATDKSLTEEEEHLERVFWKGVREGAEEKEAATSQNTARRSA